MSQSNEPESFRGDIAPDPKTDAKAEPKADPKGDPKGDHRIAKLLARAGVASRREIERMIVEGRVALNGTVLDTPATILKSLAGVTVDGEPVQAPEAARLFLYHKPAGLLVTERDPAGRQTIYDHLDRDLPRLVPVGRLDLSTGGRLLMTTDGGLKRQLELPATGVERAYRARAYGEITQAQLEDLRDGVEIEGVRYGPIDANIERRTGANVWIELILTEGKNREVRRVLEYLGLQVSRLIRTRYGPFLLADLPPGTIGEVKQHDLVAFRKTLGSAAQNVVPGGQAATQVKVAKIERAGTRPGYEPDAPRRARLQPGGTPPRTDGFRPATIAAAAATAPRQTPWSSTQRPRTDDRPASGGKAYAPRGLAQSDRHERTPRPVVSKPFAKPFAKPARAPAARDASSDTYALRIANPVATAADNARPSKPYARRDGQTDAPRSARDDRSASRASRFVRDMGEGRNIPDPEGRRGGQRGFGRRDGPPAGGAPRFGRDGPPAGGTPRFGRDGDAKPFVRRGEGASDAPRYGRDGGTARPQSSGKPFGRRTEAQGDTTRDAPRFGRDDSRPRRDDNRPQTGRPQPGRPQFGGPPRGDRPTSDTRPPRGGDARPPRSGGFDSRPPRGGGGSSGGGFNPNGGGRRPTRKS